MPKKHNKYPGVSYHKPSGAWQARLYLPGDIRIPIGYYATEIEAAAAVAEAQVRHSATLFSSPLARVFASAGVSVGRIDAIVPTLRAAGYAIVPRNLSEGTILPAGWTEAVELVCEK